jgi:hypothetical protein
MCLRWTAAGMLEAERQFRKIIGYQHLAATRAPPDLTHLDHDQAGRYARSRSLITGPPPPSATANGTTSASRVPGTCFAA